MSRCCPFCVLTQVKTADLERLRHMARTIAQNVSSVSFDYWVEIRSDGVAFCFESSDVAFLFNAYCLHEGIEVVIAE